VSGFNTTAVRKRTIGAKCHILLFSDSPGDNDNQAMQSDNDMPLKDFALSGQAGLIIAKESELKICPLCIIQAPMIIVTEK
jgi:hypothetical protein